MLIRRSIADLNLPALLLAVAAILEICSPPLSGHELAETFEAVRPLGMGGAFTGLANDSNAPWTNPAGVARIRKARSRAAIHLISVPALTLGANSEGRVFSDYILGSQGGVSASQAKEAFANIDGLASKPMWAYAASNPMMFFDAPRGSPGAVGLFTTSRMQVVVDEDSEGESAFVNTITDVGAILNLGWTNRSNRLNFGLNLRPLSRYDFNDKVLVVDLLSKKTMQDNMQSQSNSGRGLGVDVGMLWTIADFWFPTFGIAVRNLPTGCRGGYLNSYAEIRQTVCGTTFSGTVNNPESPSLVDPMDLRIGLSITPRMSQKIGLRFAFDLHHLYLTDGSRYYGLSGIDPLRMLHAGMELFYGNPLLVNPLSVRLGLNQGFITMGASIRLHFLTIEIASFGQNISSSSTPREDRRTLATLTTEL